MKADRIPAHEAQFDTNFTDSLGKIFKLTKKSDEKEDIGPAFDWQKVISELGA